MTFLASLIRFVAKLSRGICNFFNRVSRFLNGLLPAVLSPRQLNTFTQEFYADYYSKESPVMTPWPRDYVLEPWETQIFDRYQINSGKMLVLGSGEGRESIAIARKGVTVVGVESNGSAVPHAFRFARSTGVPAHFLQGSFLELPFLAKSFEFILLTDVMYSAMPDPSARQDWLISLQHLLKPNGLVVLSFGTEQQPTPRLKKICARFNAWLVKLPGANRTYTLGDEYAFGHFMHFFQNQEEIQQELLAARVTILELDWNEGYAVVTYPSTSNPPLRNLGFDRQPKAKAVS